MVFEIFDDCYDEHGCHPDSMWTCLGCESRLCERCDGIAGDQTMCWECVNVEDVAS